MDTRTGDKRLLSRRRGSISAVSKVGLTAEEGCRVDVTAIERAVSGTVDGIAVKRGGAGEKASLGLSVGVLGT